MEVVLNVRVSGRVCPDGVCVYVVETLCTQEVFHRLVVAGKILAECQSDVEHLVLPDVAGQCRREGCRHVVIVLCLHVVEGVLSVGGSLTVGIIEPVPLNLPVLLAAPPCDGCLPVGVCLCRPVACIALVPYVVEAAREVLPVVRLRIFAVVVVQLGALVHRVFGEEACCQFRLLADVPVPCEDGGRCEVVDDAAVALVSVLVAPVRIVLIVVGKPVSLVRTRSLRGALGRVAPCRQGQ